MVLEFKSMLVNQILEDNRIENDYIGAIGKIPIRNLWLLMFYASSLFRDLEQKKISIEENPDDIPDLVAEILCRRVEYRIKRNLFYGYQSREEVLGRVRGRINLLYSERHQLLDRGKIACRFDELTIDTARNRYVKSALEAISKMVSNGDLAHKCRLLAATLQRMGVVGDCPPRAEISNERFGRHDSDDRPMVSAAHLAFNLALPTEFSGSKHLTSPDRTIVAIRRLFEKAIAGFYDVVLKPEGWSVTASKRLHWQIQGKSAKIDMILPSMEADIILDHAKKNCRIIIDTKFNEIFTKSLHRPEILRSGYIYQIYAYIRSQEDSDQSHVNRASGLLLHPSVGYFINEYVDIQNHRFRFANVDLGAKACEIRQQLITIINDFYINNENFRSNV